MLSLNSRMRRVIGAVRDPLSYRLLWYALTRRGISPQLHGTMAADISIDEPVAGETRIPKLIFHTWKSNGSLAANYYYWRESFIQKNPGFKLIFWGALENRTFVKHRFPWFLRFYDSYPDEVFRANIIRVLFCYVYGGFCVHMDSECIRPLDDMRDLGDVLLGRMGQDSQFEHSLPNAVMASKAKQAFWLLALSLAIERLANIAEQPDPSFLRPEWLTGAILIKSAAEFYQNHSQDEVRRRISSASADLSILAADSDFGTIFISPATIWCPVNWNNFLQTVSRRHMFKNRLVVAPADTSRLFPEAYIVTYWSQPWAD
jgi:inositol phosphorylceramide mannosyltransferase catalytic subunit